MSSKLRCIISTGDEQFKAIPKAASEIKDVYIKPHVYISISNKLLEQGKKKESKEVIIKSLRFASEMKNIEDKSYAYFKISQILLELGEKRKALNVISKILDKFNKFKAYVNLSKVLMEHGDKKESLKVASEITDLLQVSIRNIDVNGTGKKRILKVASEIKNHGLNVCICKISKIIGTGKN